MFGNNYTKVIRKTNKWVAIFAPITLIYLATAFYVMFNYQPVSRFFPFPSKSAESLSIDLIFVVAPLVGAIAYYVANLNNTQSETRRKFILDYQNSDLVYQGHNHNLIYLVLERNSSDSVTKMQVVWTSDGRCIGGKVYEEVVGTNIIKFDPARFEKG